MARNVPSVNRRSVETGVIFPANPFSCLFRRLFDLVQDTDLQEAGRGHKCQSHICV